MLFSKLRVYLWHESFVSIAFAVFCTTKKLYADLNTLLLHRSGTSLEHYMPI